MYLVTLGNGVSVTLSHHICVGVIGYWITSGLHMLMHILHVSTIVVTYSIIIEHARSGIMIIQRKNKCENSELQYGHN